MDMQCGYYDIMCDIWEDWSTYSDELDKEDKIEYYLYKHHLSLMLATGVHELDEMGLMKMVNHKNQENNKNKKRAFRKAINSLKEIEKLIFEE